MNPIIIFDYIKGTILNWIRMNGKGKVSHLLIRMIICVEFYYASDKKRSQIGASIFVGHFFTTFPVPVSTPWYIAPKMHTTSCALLSTAQIVEFFKRVIHFSFWIFVSNKSIFNLCLNVILPFNFFLYPNNHTPYTLLDWLVCILLSPKIKVRQRLYSRWLSTHLANKETRRRKEGICLVFCYYRSARLHSHVNCVVVCLRRARTQSFARLPPSQKHTINCRSDLSPYHHRLLQLIGTPLFAWILRTLFPVSALLGVNLKTPGQKPTELGKFLIKICSLAPPFDESVGVFCADDLSVGAPSPNLTCIWRAPFLLAIVLFLVADLRTTRAAGSKTKAALSNSARLSPLLRRFVVGHRV